MKAPEQITNFVANDQSGSEFDLDKKLEAGPIVLFFYPKASSPVCTVQSCKFRDLNAEFSELNVTVAGVSNDSETAQAKFDSSNDLGVPLLVDKNAEIAERFGIKRKFGLPAKRATFVVGPERKIMGEHYSELNGASHAEWALEFVQNMVQK